MASAYRLNLCANCLESLSVLLVGLRYGYVVETHSGRMISLEGAMSTDMRLTRVELSCGSRAKVIDDFAPLPNEDRQPSVCPLEMTCQIEMPRQRVGREKRQTCCGPGGAPSSTFARERTDRGRLPLPEKCEVLHEVPSRGCACPLVGNRTLFVSKEVAKTCRSARKDGAGWGKKEVLPERRPED